jgi:hypothetical protein
MCVIKHANYSIYNVHRISYMYRDMKNRNGTIIHF